jgi:hypothetical protein
MNVRRSEEGSEPSEGEVYILTIRRAFKVFASADELLLVLGDGGGEHETLLPHFFLG